jgi:hypothetical protein
MRYRLIPAAVATLAVAGILAIAPNASGADPVRATSPYGSCTNAGRLSIDVVGLTSDQRLICFRADRPGRARDIGAVTGLDTDTTLVGIDARTANGAYYGVGDQGGVYTVDTSNARVTLVGRIDVPLRGTSFGVDFNPAADRLRIVSDAGQNLRINVDTVATLVDTDLSYTPGTPATGVVAAAYSNNDLSADTATTLFDVDSALDQVAVQSPPNNGSLAPTGKLGVDAVGDASADIFTRTRDGAAQDNTGFAVLNGSTFHRLDVLTGRVTKVGTFSGKYTVIGIAVPVSRR